MRSTPHPPATLWDPTDEKSSCGVGFITRKDGVQRHEVITMAAQALCSVPHRGGISAEGVGDGGGVCIDLSAAFFRKVTGLPDLRLGRFCVGNFFLPSDPAGASRAARLIESTMTDRGFAILAVRDVPVDDSVLLPAAVAYQLPIRQWVFAAPEVCPEPAGLDLLVQQALLHIEAIGYTNPKLAGLYPLSLSARTQVLKGRLSSPEVIGYFSDLADPDHAVHTIYFHTRFSTNTDPHPTMAQPFRYLAHNGELNTDKKNRIAQVTAAAAARRTIVRPPGQSDSSRLDQTVATRVTEDHLDLVTAIVSMMPPAWENDTTLSPAVRAMFEYFSLYEEKNDGPAAVVFGDGQVIGARLDRLGLRPLRTVETADYLCVFSEAGQIDFDPARVIARGRVSAGGMVYYDHREHRTYRTEEVYQKLAAQADYPALLAAAKVDLADLPVADPSADCSDDDPAASVLNDHQRYRAYFLDQESFRYFMDPMLDSGGELVSAMGFGLAVNALTNREASVARFFSQRFAQVTNPPLDSIREADGMSLRVALGIRPQVFASARERGGTTPAVTTQIVLPTPVLTEADLAILRAQTTVPTSTLHAVRPAASRGRAALAAAIDTLGDEVVAFARHTGGIAILSDRTISTTAAAVPMALAVPAINQRLIEAGLRLRVSLVVDSGQVESSHHLAVLLGFGASAVHPHSVARRARQRFADDPTAAFARWRKAAEKSLMKTMGRVGLCTVESYIGGEFFEPNLLDTADDDLARWFPNLRSPAGGAGLAPIAEAVDGAHDAAITTPCEADRDLPLLGLFKERGDGAGHSFGVAAVRHWEALTDEAPAYATAADVSPVADAAGADAALPVLTLAELADAFGLGADAYDDSSFAPLTPEQIDAFTITGAYRELVAGLNAERAERPSAIRDILAVSPAAAPLPLTRVSPAHEITRTFASGAMSHGALVAPAHEAVAHGTNMVGGLSNSGEGGEHFSRYGTIRASRIKQFASGRFGIWAGYLADPELTELEIKIGQGAKPGEGGQLPAPKVTVEIAAARGGTPGVELVSPPPHHDTYSIEDLAQLIHDCKAARVRVIVKLVSSEGIGTIAVGVAKAGADVINVAGNTGGTGAAAVSSLRYAGRAAEIGLAEVHQALCANGLRQKVVLRASGAHQTGRDVLVSALLGADSFEFGTAALMSIGCVMAKNCNVKCPAGLTTNPEMFEGDPRAMAQYLLNVAAEVREILAANGLASLRAARGRADLLAVVDHPATVGAIRPDALLAVVEEKVIANPVYAERDYAIDDALAQRVRTALLADARSHVTTARLHLCNRNKSVGAQLAIDIERMLNWELDPVTADALGPVLRDDRGRRYLSPDTVRIPTTGSAGQSYAAFCNDGMHMVHTGTCNDGVGKSMSGGTVVVRSPGGGSSAAGDNVLIGNFALFGATGGRLFVEGEAGDRFAVRNSGATAVIEGLGEYGCEYMTNGAVLNLGGYGNGLANGMSGGFLYQYDPACTIDARISSDSVVVGAITGVDDPFAPLHHAAARMMLEWHAEATGSALATRLLQNWETERHYIVYAMPRALLAHQDSATIMASLDRRALLDELSQAIAGEQVRSLKRSLRTKKPVNGGAVPAFGRTDDETAFRLLGALTVFELAREVAAVALKRARHGTGLPTGDRALTRAARNLVLTEDFHLVARVARYARDILADYSAEALAALIGAKRVADYKAALELRNVASMDAPATYGWLLYQDARNRDLLGGLPSFDELFASRAVPGVAESLIARGFGAIPDTNTLDVPVPPGAIAEIVTRSKAG
ncbi:MAG TPA: glutamate synthase-related protein [Gordonia sp. (in: high G+C Gram-positive bacteria)]|uniref:glutamate synthase-related protein n=1 Tax=unclassified Gordonia (in: high G+C Gram-positive bacteria) TaxID=2657482 RepID=UPI0025BE40B8|nr:MULTISPECIES: glutamate synthase-related protein [unclassified Gordonia (in: high G+C Gram-positive bacteria)]HNP57461.1 glutamate synthase-related protein [Gordonia sp. (in: high G+C Gram-positive bacteria)]HRC51216.1 glutamate synthase-related protein [Gordonia sp. (in: high G+C Gram-positive bacteria)]